MNRYVKLATVLGLGLTASIAAFASPWGHGGHHGHGKAKMEAFMKLPVEKQTLILSTIKQVREENAGLREEIDTTRESLKEVLTAPSFDEAAFKANVEKLENLMTQGFRAFTDAVSQIAPQLTQEEREALAQMAPHGGRISHNLDEPDIEN
jgi:Spy/CpxP family protein refolding chaperone